MNYKDATYEQIIELMENAEVVFNNPKMHSSIEMIDILKQMDELIDSYEKCVHGNNVEWMRVKI